MPWYCEHVLFLTYESALPPHVSLLTPADEKPTSGQVKCHRGHINNRSFEDYQRNNGIPYDDVDLGSLLTKQGFGT